MSRVCRFCDYREVMVAVVSNIQFFVRLFRIIRMSPGNLCFFRVVFRGGNNERVNGCVRERGGSPQICRVNLDVERSYLQNLADKGVSERHGKCAADVEDTTPSMSRGEFRRLGMGCR